MRRGAMKWAVLASLCVGCAATDIEGQDREMFLPTARVFYELTGRPDREGKQTRGVFGIEGSVSGGEGDFEIDLAPGDALRIDGDVIAGPATVAAEFQFLEGSLAVRGGFRTKRGFNLQGIGGLGIHRTKADLTGPTRRLIRTIDTWGPIVGLQLGWEVAPWLEIYGRGTILFLDFDLGNSEQAEIGAQFNVSRHVSIITAYRWWRVEETDFSFSTDIDIKGGGVVVGIVVRF